MPPAGSGQPRPALAYALWLDSLTRAGWDAGPTAEQVPGAGALGRGTADPIRAAWAAIAVRGARLAADAGVGDARVAGSVALSAGTFEWVDTGDPMPEDADT